MLKPGDRVLVPNPDLTKEVEAIYVGPSGPNQELGRVRYADGTTAEWPPARIERVDPERRP